MKYIQVGGEPEEDPYEDSQPEEVLASPSRRWIKVVGVLSVVFVGLLVLSVGGSAASPSAQTKTVDNADEFTSLTSKSCPFNSGDVVVWRAYDEDIAKYEKGKVLGCTEDRVRAKFKKGTWRFHPGSLVLATKAKKFGPNDDKFEINDDVTWKHSDEDIPKGAKGRVVGFTNHRVRAKFDEDTWTFTPSSMEVVRATCDRFTCDAGWKNNKGTECSGNVNTCDKATCCTEPATCDSFTCDAGWTTNKGKECPGNADTCDKATCCTEPATCDNFVCDDVGFDTKLNRGKKCPGNADTCNFAICCTQTTDHDNEGKSACRGDPMEAKGMKKGSKAACIMAPIGAAFHWFEAWEAVGFVSSEVAAQGCRGLKFDCDDGRRISDLTRLYELALARQRTLEWGVKRTKVTLDCMVEQCGYKA